MGTDWADVDANKEPPTSNRLSHEDSCDSKLSFFHKTYWAHSWRVMAAKKATYKAWYDGGAMELDCDNCRWCRRCTSSTMIKIPSKSANAPDTEADQHMRKPNSVEKMWYGSSNLYHHQQLDMVHGLARIYFVLRLMFCTFWLRQLTVVNFQFSTKHQHSDTQQYLCPSFQMLNIWMNYI
jgi:hypothetical protein